MQKESMTGTASPENTQENKNRVQASTLYLVATPIGNLSDLSDRAKKVLSEVDFIAAEDTRNSLRLLTHFGIRRPLVSYHEHNRKTRGPEIVARLAAGASCALITDAGMPAISDPGEDLVRMATEANLPVTVIPGCCALVSALALSALSTTRFVFDGFLPSDGKERKKHLEALKRETRTLILYEAPHRLLLTLTDLYQVLGDRKISICRELTKINEEVIRTTLSDSIAFFRTRAPRGEYVLVIEGNTRTSDVCAESASQTASSPPSIQDAEARVQAYCLHEGISRMESIKRVAKEYGMTKSQLYRLLIQAQEDADIGKKP